MSLRGMRQIKIENFFYSVGFFKNFLKCLFIFEREGERACMRGQERAEREGDTELEAGSRLHAVSTEARTHEL